MVTIAFIMVTIAFMALFLANAPKNDDVVKMVGEPIIKVTKAKTPKELQTERHQALKDKIAHLDTKYSETFNEPMTSQIYFGEEPVDKVELVVVHFTSKTQDFMLVFDWTFNLPDNEFRIVPDEFTTKEK